MLGKLPKSAEREIDESIWIAASKGDLHGETKKAVLFLREDTKRKSINTTPTNDMREKTSSERSGGCKCFFRSTLEMEKDGNCGGTSTDSVAQVVVLGLQRWELGAADKKKLPRHSQNGSVTM